MLLLTAACARHGAEQVLLDQFFSASRLRDRTALQKISTVILEPLEQGAVTTFTITDVVDVEGPDGLVQSKQVNVSAPVRLPDGERLGDVERRPGAGGSADDRAVDCHRPFGEISVGRPAFRTKRPSAPRNFP